MLPTTSGPADGAAMCAMRRAVTAAERERSHDEQRQGSELRPGRDADDHGADVGARMLAAGGERDSARRKRTRAEDVL